jgi:hypothetical protein
MLADSTRTSLYLSIPVFESPKSLLMRMIMNSDRFPNARKLFATNPGFVCPCSSQIKPLTEQHPFSFCILIDLAGKVQSFCLSPPYVYLLKRCSFERLNPSTEARLSPRCGFWASFRLLRHRRLKISRSCA